MVFKQGENGSSCPWTHNWGARGRLPRRRNKTELEEKGSFLVRGWSNSQKKNRGEGEERGSERQNMFGKCSTTCLQFIINFLEASQSYGSGAHASGAIPFFAGRCDSAAFYYVYLHVFSVPAIHEVVWGNTCCQRANKRTLCLQEKYSSPYIWDTCRSWMDGRWIAALSGRQIKLFIPETISGLFHFCFSHLNAALKRRLLLSNQFPY